MDNTPTRKERLKEWSMWHCPINRCCAVLYKGAENRDGIRKHLKEHGFRELKVKANLIWYKNDQGGFHSSI